MGQRDVLGLDRRRAEPRRLVTGALQQREGFLRRDQPRRLRRQMPVAAVRGLAGDAETAAPAARLILSKWFGVKDTTFHAGSSATL